VLVKRLDVDVCDAPQIVAACCVLNNVRYMGMHSMKHG